MESVAAVKRRNGLRTIGPALAILIVLMLAATYVAAALQPAASAPASSARPRDRIEATQTDASSPSATDRCTQAATAFGEGTVVGAFLVTAEEVASWQERKHQMVNPPIRSELAPDAPVSVCYVDGAFGSARGPVGHTIPDYDRIVVLIGPDDDPRLYASTHRSSFPVEDPRSP